ncbi:MAG: GNAT family N-acetyltransferase [Lachnospiraceae bacterium]|nr:GNAT family N-acetyltransferase [Lachnospiraceae bacterium]
MKNRQEETIKIQRAKQTDEEIVRGLQNEIFYEDYKKYGYCPNWGKTLEETEALIKRRDVYLIIVKDKCAGIAVVRVHGMECHISSIGIKKESRGKRIGTFVMGQIERSYPNAWVFTLDTYSGKKEAIHFYKSLGYQIAGSHMEGNLKLTCFQKKQGS